MAAPKIVHGARGKVAIVDPATGKAQVVGIFSSVSYTVTHGVAEAYALGSFTPVELAYTHTQPVQLTLQGWRELNHGPHAEPRFPRVQDLLLHEYLEMAVVDRVLESQGGDGRIAKIRSIRPVSYSTSIVNRQLTEMTFQCMGIMVDDETATNAEAPGSTQLP